jgi:hypothetical protein
MNLNREENTSHADWLHPITSHSIRHLRHTDVSQDPRYNPGYLSADTGDAECTSAPRRIPDWVLSHEETQALHAAGYGTAPDLIYARGVPDSTSPDPTSFNKKLCTLIIIEIGFCRDLGCDEKRETKTNKYIHLVRELRKHWGTVEFIAFPIGHTGTTLKATLDHLTAAFSTARPREDRSRARMDITNTVTDHTARTHDYNLFKSLMDSLTDLAQSRLLDIISNRRRSVATLPGSASRRRTYSDAGTSHRTTHETRAQGSVDMDLSQSGRLNTCTAHTRKRTLDAVGIVSRNRAHSAAAPAHTGSHTAGDSHTHTQDSHHSSTGEHRHHIDDVGTG